MSIVKSIVLEEIALAIADGRKQVNEMANLIPEYTESDNLWHDALIKCVEELQNEFDKETEYKNYINDTHSVIFHIPSKKYQHGKLKPGVASRVLKNLQKLFDLSKGKDIGRGIKLYFSSFISEKSLMLADFETRKKSSKEINEDIETLKKGLKICLETVNNALNLYQAKNDVEAEDAARVLIESFDKDINEVYKIIRSIRDIHPKKSEVKKQDYYIIGVPSIDFEMKLTLENREFLNLITKSLQNMKKLYKPVSDDSRSISKTQKIKGELGEIYFWKDSDSHYFIVKFTENGKTQSINVYFEANEKYDEIIKQFIGTEIEIDVVFKEGKWHLGEWKYLEEKYKLLQTEREKEFIHGSKFQSQKSIVKEQKENYKTSAENDDNISGNIDEALNLIKNGNYYKAIEVLESIIQNNNTNAIAYASIGYAYSLMFEYRKALQYYNQATDLDSSLLVAHLDKGVAYCELGQYEKAVDCFNVTKELNPDYAKTYLDFGIVYYKKKDFENAIKYFELAIEKKSDYTHALNNLGVAYGDINETEKAIDCFNKTLEIDPVYSKSMYNLGVAYYKIGDLLHAKEYLNKALKVDPHYEHAREMINEINGI